MTISLILSFNFLRIGFQNFRKYLMTFFYFALIVPVINLTTIRDVLQDMCGSGDSTSSSSLCLDVVVVNEGE